MGQPKQRHKTQKKIIRLRGEWLLQSQDFSVTQILREINFGESRSSKIAIFGALNFVDLVNISLQKVQKVMKNQNSEPLSVLKLQILLF